MNKTYAVANDDEGVLCGLYYAESDTHAVYEWARVAGYDSSDIPSRVKAYLVADPAPVVVGRHTYTVSLAGPAVTIYRDRVLAGSGRWAGRIEDCPADLGDDVYDELDKAIADVTGEAIPARRGRRTHGAE